jgi:hypothetical protein
MANIVDRLEMRLNTIADAIDPTKWELLAAADELRTADTGAQPILGMKDQQLISNQAGLELLWDDWVKPQGLDDEVGHKSRWNLCQRLDERFIEVEETEVAGDVLNYGSEDEVGLFIMDGEQTPVDWNNVDINPEILSPLTRVFDETPTGNGFGGCRTIVNKTFD